MTKRAPRNRTLTCSPEELQQYAAELVRLDAPTGVDALDGAVINQNLFDCIEFLPDSFVDLLILDPPYNLTKDYNGRLFRSRKAEAYTAWFEETIAALARLLTPGQSRGRPGNSRLR